MKCLGAQDALVVKLFLLESAFQGIVGAGLGTVVGLLIALISAVLQFAGYGLANFPAQQMWQVMGWSVLSGIVLAVLGAVPSALMAARMNPVDALRIEE
jgi:ABC-type antimicrobial peptide transport system permease subunit